MEDSGSDFWRSQHRKVIIARSCIAAEAGHADVKLWEHANT